MAVIHSQNGVLVRQVASFTGEIGGRIYRTVSIGGVTWLAENLDLKFRGLFIGRTNTSTSEPRGNYYNNDEITYGISGNKYGLLYNWFAVNYLESNKSTLIPGWHVPSTTEWDALANAVGGASTAGTVLKSTTDWTSGAGTDVYGFGVLPTGGRADGSFYWLGMICRFWTSSREPTNSAAAVCWEFDSSASMNKTAANKTNYMYSVRLVKDS